MLGIVLNSELTLTLVSFFLEVFPKSCFSQN